jgi:hypothetical protein
LLSLLNDDCLLSSAAFVVDSEDALLWLLLHNPPIVSRVRLIFFSEVAIAELFERLLLAGNTECIWQVVADHFSTTCSVSGWPSRRVNHSVIISLHIHHLTMTTKLSRERGSFVAAFGLDFSLNDCYPQLMTQITRVSSDSRGCQRTWVDPELRWLSLGPLRSAQWCERTSAWL